ncbi:putative Snf7 family protein [Giardia duodenalis assemblage B]|uniref:Snf7 family protein n=3 Tax=Giardia intestinalis TaxID=5741 RepID=C6LR49_GIAIB|nr:Hypothetical protein GL50581_1231 [Giardia intestinalis ATCC 50581]ESU42009.1 Putative Snf7 family protein [Giardia intestinalis]KWX12245.1 putative Snf7 family protein [Giardia intestinalis assemblage B]
MKERTIAASLEAYKEKAKETIRSIDRERMQLEFERKKVEQQIRKAAQDGDRSSAEIHAKCLVRIKDNIKRLCVSKAQIMSLQMNMQLAKSFEVVGGIISKSAAIMASLNKNVNNKEMQQQLAKFSREMQNLQIRQNYMEDCLDSAIRIDNESSQASREVDMVMSEFDLLQKHKLGMLDADSYMAECAQWVPGSGDVNSIANK